MKMSRRDIPIYIGVSLLLLTATMACKPTEKNYRAAYEAAQRKETDALEGMGVTVPLQSDEHLGRRTIGGHEVWVSHELLRGVAVEGSGYTDAGLKNKYGVAVALYRMRTNAMAQAERTNAGGDPTVVATDGRERWYVVKDVSEAIRTAADAADSIARTQSAGTKLPGLQGPAVVSMR